MQRGRRAPRPAGRRRPGWPGSRAAGRPAPGRCRPARGRGPRPARTARCAPPARSAAAPAPPPAARPGPARSPPPCSRSSGPTSTVDSSASVPRSVRSRRADGDRHVGDPGRRVRTRLHQQHHAACCPARRSRPRSGAPLVVHRARAPAPTAAGAGARARRSARRPGTPPPARGTRRSTGPAARRRRASPPVTVRCAEHDVDRVRASNPRGQRGDDAADHGVVAGRVLGRRVRDQLGRAHRVPLGQERQRRHAAPATRPRPRRTPTTPPSAGRRTRPTRVIPAAPTSGRYASRVGAWSWLPAIAMTCAPVSPQRQQRAGPPAAGPRGRRRRRRTGRRRRAPRRPARSRAIRDDLGQHLALLVAAGRGP